MNFDRNVNMLCRHHNLTLEALARKAEVRPDWLRRAVSQNIKKITKSNRQQVTRIAMVLNVEPDILFADTGAKPIDPQYTNELKEILDLTNQMLAYRDRKLNEYVQIILNQYDVKRPTHYDIEYSKLSDKVRAIVLNSRSSSLDISEELDELLMPYRNLKDFQPNTVQFTWRDVIPSMEHESMRPTASAAKIFSGLLSRGFAEGDVISLMNAYYDHFQVFYWQDHHLPTLDAILRSPDVPEPPRAITTWDVHDDSDEHPAQMSYEAGVIVNALMDAGASEKEAVRALNYFWDKNELKVWRESKINQYVDDIQKMMSQGKQS